MDNVHTRGAGSDSNDKALARKSRDETKPNDDADDAAESQITAGARIDYNGVSLIPCLLAEERPKDMDTLWPKRRYLSPSLSLFFSPPLDLLAHPRMAAGAVMAFRSSGGCTGSISCLRDSSGA
jgi:hypothetical protein